jgi:hypothetical protein
VWKAPLKWEERRFYSYSSDVIRNIKSSTNIIRTGIPLKENTRIKISIEEVRDTETMT